MIKIKKKEEKMVWAKKPSNTMNILLSLLVLLLATGLEASTKKKPHGHKGVLEVGEMTVTVYSTNEIERNIVRKLEDSSVHIVKS